MKSPDAGSERSPGRVLGTRAVTAVLATALTAGVLVPLIVLWLGHGAAGGRPGPSGAPQVTVPRPRPLPQSVGGARVTTIAAGNGVIAYGTEDGGLYASPVGADPRRIARLNERVVKLAFDSGGRWLAAVDLGSRLAVVDTARPNSPVAVRSIRAQSPLYRFPVPSALAIDSTGSRVAAQTDAIGIYDLRGGPSAPHDDPPRWLDEVGDNDLAFVDGDLVTASTDPGVCEGDYTCVHVYDVSTLRMERQIRFPVAVNALIDHGRLLSTTLSHAFVLDYRTTSPQPGATAAPGRPRPALGSTVAEKTISTRRSPSLRPVAYDGHLVAVMLDARLVFFEPASRRTLATVRLSFATCPSTAGPAPLAEFSTSFSPDHKTLAVAGFCPPANDVDDDTEEGRRLSTYRYWVLAYPSLSR
ncbi:hypothetical protein GCM10018793_43070 [Streptomyces sulfonofaciens]|uniref:Uncharacterized protein n=1 Tax=Streptomyces sulfonofaciens TaxID=68272 RepID=A0A919GF09_9ACTN|nr:hypothetical protein [Streptomyces sulfonofaciens]GHH82739.1 hypothetical protein GCM10018793_43070 [Streptomyces sulfonofaciens]